MLKWLGLFFLCIGIAKLAVSVYMIHTKKRTKERKHG